MKSVIVGVINVYVFEYVLRQITLFTERKMGWSLKVNSKHAHLHEIVTKVMPYMEICPDRHSSLTWGFHVPFNIIHITTDICLEYIVINEEPTKIKWLEKMITPVRKTNSIKREIPITYGSTETKAVLFFLQIFYDEPVSDCFLFLQNSRVPHIRNQFMRNWWNVWSGKDLPFIKIKRDNPKQA